MTLSHTLSPAHALTLEQVISREHPDFNAAKSTMTVGRDGLVYLAFGGNSAGYLLRLSRDGKTKIGGPISYAAHNATANDKGQVAVASAHFSHAVTLFDTGLQKTAAFNDILNSDTVGWDAPARVEAGQSGDFYAADQHRDRILRISPEGKLLRAYNIAPSSNDNNGKIEEFRVDDAREMFWIETRSGPLRAMGFDGKVKWSANIPGNWQDGGFDVDENGVLFAIDGHGDTIKKFALDGTPAGETKLQMGALQPAPDGPAITALQIFGNEVLVKKNSPTELFERYSLTDGKLLNAVNSDFERLSVSYEKDQWTAGQSVPFALKFDAGGRIVKPQWRVWLRPLNAPSYRELKLENNRVLVPQDAAGIYQIKVTPETQPVESGAPSEYIVRSWVEIRAPDSHGTINVFSPDNRVQYAAGETVPLSILVRSAAAINPALTIRLSEFSGGAAGRIIAESKGAPDAAGVLALSLPSSLTRALRTGDYIVTANANSFTSVPQYLTIGSGDDGTNFHIVRHGDYGATYPTSPTANLWNAPDVATSYVEREHRLGFNFLVDRLGTPDQINNLSWSQQEQAALAEYSKKLQSEPDGAAPEKTRMGTVFQQVMAGYGARGIDQMAILMMMDAGLPLGSGGFDPRSPAQLQKDVARVTQALTPYPSFRGWSWHSNWWVNENTGSKAAKTPEEKIAYEAALKAARETGVWNEVLDRVADYRLNYAVDAQQLFNDALHQAAPNSNLVTASAGTYRNVESYPPISFGNVDEVDLQGQFEQILLPFFPAHAVDFYRRPGKPVWGHPEIWNDSGTGDQILPELFAMFMRGADGVGTSGAVPMWARAPYATMREDGRSSAFGEASIYRAANDVFKNYGAWLRALQGDDRVAIAISARPFKIDQWSPQNSTTGVQFARVLEAWASCLEAHHPASFVFAEDVKPDSFKNYKAVLVVGQTVEMEPQLQAALKNAQAGSVKVFADGTCRESLVKEYSPLGVSFDKFEKDPHPASDDAAHQRFPQYVAANLPALKKALDGVSTPVAQIENPEVWASQRKSGAGKYVFIVNHSSLPLEPGKMWRESLFVASRLPVQANVGFTNTAPAIYDVLEMKKIVAANGGVNADLRDVPFRVYALLPQAIESVALRGPSTLAAGQTFKWWTQARDAADKSIDAAIPIRVRLFDSGGNILREQFVSSDAKGASGEWTIPLNLSVGACALEATELFSGQSTRLALNVKAATLPLALDTKFGVAEADASGKASTPSTAPVAREFGPHARDVAILDAGKVAVINTHNWNGNLQGIDCDSGKTLWRSKIGDGFAFEPKSIKGGFVAQGMDFDSAEGYFLYLGDASGRVARRFGLYGLPRRLPHRFVPGMLKDRDDPLNNFAAPDDGSWVASAGDLGLAIWARDGKKLWQQDWWTSERHTARLDAPDASTLIVAPSGHGIKVAAYGAQSGKTKWNLDLAPTGVTQKIAHSQNGRTLALMTSFAGGRVFVIRDGKLLSTLPTAGFDVALAPDGNSVAIVEANVLKFYDAAEGLRWSFAGDDFLRAPRFSPDGKRVAVGSELGTVSVLGQDGVVLFQEDNAAITTPVWLPNGDLLLANWMGKVSRLDADYQTKWSTLLRSSPASTSSSDDEIGAKDTTPAVRVTGWGNAEKTPLPITPNLLSEIKPIISLNVEGQPTAILTQPFAALFDGKPDAPSAPWLSWSDLNSWSESDPQTAIVFDAFRTQMRVNAITFYEDLNHPESWLRDARLEYWDADKEQWIFVMNLLSDAAIHSHKLPAPIETGKLRVVIPKGIFGNVRWGEVVLSGQALGASHPDVIAKRSRAVLFDESEAFKDIFPYVDRWSFGLDGAFSGARFLQVNADQTVGPNFIAAYGGHFIPTWDFEIAENPQPGQYRWLQFAVKALGPNARGATLNLRGTQNIRLHLGQASGEELGGTRKVGDAVPTQWKTVRVDLWDAFKNQPARIQSMFLSANGAPVGFDQIVLGRTEADLPPQK